MYKATPKQTVGGAGGRKKAGASRYFARAASEIVGRGKRYFMERVSTCCAVRGGPHAVFSSTFFSTFFGFMFREFLLCFGFVRAGRRAGVCTLNEHVLRDSHCNRGAIIHARTCVKRLLSSA